MCWDPQLKRSALSWPKNLSKFFSFLLTYWFLSSRDRGSKQKAVVQSFCLLWGRGRQKKKMMKKNFYCNRGQQSVINFDTNAWLKFQVFYYWLKCWSSGNSTWFPETLVYHCVGSQCYKCSHQRILEIKCTSLVKDILKEKVKSWFRCMWYVRTTSGIICSLTDLLIWNLIPNLLNVTKK